MGAELDPAAAGRECRGARPRGPSGPGGDALEVARAGDSLILRVTNTIAAASSPAPPGIGISNVRERLAVQFEGRAELVAGPRGDEWVSEITLPEIHASPEPRGTRRPRC